MEEMTMRDDTTNPIEKAREECLKPVSPEVFGWLFSPQFLVILQLSHVAGVICAFLKRKSLPKAPYHGRAEVYSDVSILITAVVMKVWKLSLGEITRRLRLYP